MLRATRPRAFRVASDGSTTVNTDYFTSVELTGTNPQVVTYTINPKAVWTDGTPDHVGRHRRPDPRHQRQGQGLRHRQPQRRDRVASVTRGVDDRQAIMTFAKPYSEWRGMFAGNTMLLPKSMTANPEVFNKGQLNGPGPSAGPFMVSATGPDRATHHVDT